MTDIEQKALELVNAVRAEQAGKTIAVLPEYVALCRALEAHEADKSRHAAEMREQAERFSEAAGRAVPVIEMLSASMIAGVKKRAEVDAAIQALTPYLTAPVDPLVEAAQEVAAAEAKKFGLELKDYAVEQEWADNLRAALEARGLAIVKKED